MKPAHGSSCTMAAHSNFLRDPLRTMLIVLGFVCTLPLSVIAGQKETPDHIVYFSSIDSRLVPPLVARAHGLPRGPRYLTVSVSVHEVESGKAVSALVRGEVNNLLAQQVDLQFREVRENDALYYLATYTADQQDTHHYRLIVEPQGKQHDYQKDDTSAPIEVTFDYRYFTGEETIAPLTSH